MLHSRMQNTHPDAADACSCYHNPDASLANIPILVSMPWLALLLSGLKATGGHRCFLASPSGRQGRRGFMHIPFYFSQQNNWFYHWVSWFTTEVNSTAWIPCSSPQWLLLPGTQGSLKGFLGCFSTGEICERENFLLPRHGKADLA